jgi:hypothetical protein
MSDQAAAPPPPAPSPPPPPAKKSWADVVDTTQHYVAGACLLAGVGYFVSTGKLSADLFIVLVTGAAGAIGIKASH